MRSLSAHSTNLLRSLWLAAQLSGIPATPPSFVTLKKLLKIHSAPSFRWLMNILNRTHYWLLRYTADYRPPTTLHATDHHSPGPAVQPVFKQFYASSQYLLSLSMRILLEIVSESLLKSRQNISTALLSYTNPVIFIAEGFQQASQAWLPLGENILFLTIFILHVPFLKTGATFAFL